LGKALDFMPPEEAKRVAEIFAPITGEMKPFVLLENVNLHKDGIESFWRPVGPRSSIPRVFPRLPGHRS
jgi:hypothetical protein